ncbi:MAG: nitroreductase [Eubacteriaceae bacterium]|nr:nitroreductase [Eubacteriaceae bacterium]
MEFLDLAKKRYSVRNYMDKKVDEELLMKILEAGRVAPTAKNYQPQKLLVVQSREGLEKLGKCARIYDAPLAIVVCADHEKTWVRPLDNKDFGDVDASIITDHMMLQATELGLGSVWVCYFKSDVLREEFELPKNLEPINILLLGYAAGDAKDPDRHGVERKSLEETVFYENFKQE